MKNVLTGILLLIATHIFGQNQKCGLPSYNPKLNEAHIQIDTCGKATYLYKRPKWYRQSVILSDTAPQAEFMNGLIVINNTQADWYNTSNNVYYKWTGTGWGSLSIIDLSNVVFITGNQTITGKKTFSDTINATKGIKSDGLIDTKGIKSTGASTTAASEVLGVQKNGVTSIATNTTIDGTYNTIIINTFSGNINVTLPTANSTNIGWQYKISKTGGNIAKIIRPNQSTISLYSTEFTITVKNTNSSWEIE